MSDDMDGFADLIPDLEERIGKKVPLLIRGMRVVEYMDEDGSIGTWYEASGDRSKRSMASILDIAHLLVLGVRFDEEDDEE